MTTYSGKSSQYDPGRVHPNKEPRTSLDVIEKMYKQHREKLQEIQPLVDDHVLVPSFMKNQSWKKLQIKHHDEEIATINESIYKRLTKVEARESAIATDAKTHIKRVNQQLKYWKSVNDYDRNRRQIKIQKENESFMQRIEKTRPAYTLQSCKDWYKHHERFKSSRRHDPTAGHLMKGMRGLLPPPLPPIDKSHKVENSSMISTSFEERSYVSSQQNGTSSRSSRSRGLQNAYDRSSSPTLLSTVMEPLPSLISSGSSIYSANKYSTISSGSLYSHNHTKARIGRAGWTATANPTSSKILKLQKPSVTSKFGILVNSNSIDEDLMEESEDSYGNTRIVGESIVPFQSLTNDDNVSLTSKGSEYGSFYGSPKKLLRPRSEANLASLSTQSLKSLEKTSTSNPDDKIVLFARPQLGSNETKNCIIQICTRKDQMDELTIRVLSSGNTPKVLTERVIHVEDAYEIINDATANSSMINEVTKHEDIQALRTLLVNMFREADIQNSGYLTFDQFQQLMEKINLGISSQELRFVISEADENENGVIDFDEYVPIAADLIQSFRARAKAKSLLLEADITVDDQVLSTLAKEEIKTIASVCLMKIQDIDSRKYGVIRPIDLRRCLASSSLNELEINMLCQLLPRDSFGRCNYENFEDAMIHVRFLSLKNSAIEAHGSELQRYLLEACKDEEDKIRSMKGQPIDGGVSSTPRQTATLGIASTTPTRRTITPTNIDYGGSSGVLPVRSLINILYNAPRLTLSRLQVLVIMAEAVVLDGMINYYQFIPLVAKTIEIMFEPKALRQRAELIEKTTYTSDILLDNLHHDGFRHKLLTLFKCYDIDHNNVLDMNEFIACLAALDLQLTRGEIISLMHASAIISPETLQFEEFANFFTNNLISLEREKHVRILQSKIHLNHKASFDMIVSPKNNLQGNFSSYSQSSPSRMKQLHGYEEVVGPSYNTDLMFHQVSGAGGSRNALPSSVVKNIYHPTSLSSSQQPNTSTLQSNAFMGDYDMNLTAEGLIPHIAAVFRIADKRGQGYLSTRDISDTLRSLDIRISSFELDMLLDGVETDASGDVDYKAFTTICAELLETFRAYAIVTESRLDKEKWAIKKAEKMVGASYNDIQASARYIKDKFHLVQETIVDNINRQASLEEVLLHPNSGLDRSEVPLIMAKLFIPPNSLSLLSPQAGNKQRFGSFMMSPTQVSAGSLIRKGSNSTTSSTPAGSLIRNGSSSTINSTIPAAVAAKRMSRQFSSVVTPLLNTNSNQSALFAPQSIINNELSSNQNNRIQEHYILRSDVNVVELSDIISEIRKSTIIRGLTDDLHPNDLKSKLLKHLNKESKQMKSKGLLEEDSPYLPLQTCLHIVETLHAVRIHKAKVIAIISWANCYDVTGMMLDYVKFALHTADVLSRLHDSHFMELFYNQPGLLHDHHHENSIITDDNSKKSSALGNIKDIHIPDSKLFNGMKDIEVKAYLTTSYIKLDNGNQEVSQEDFIQVLRHIPRLHLSAHDALAVLSNLPSSMIINPDMTTMMMNSSSIDSNSSISMRRGSLMLPSTRRGSVLKAPVAGNSTGTGAITPATTKATTTKASSRKSSISAAIAATAAAVAATKTLLSENTLIKWKEFIITSYDILRIILYERQMQQLKMLRSTSSFLVMPDYQPKNECMNDMFNRPLSSIGDHQRKEEIGSLKMLSKQLMDQISTKVMDRIVSIILPCDGIQRQSSMLGMNHNPTLAVSADRAFAITDDDVEEIVKIAAIIPLLSSSFVARESTSPSFYHNIKASLSSLSRLPVLMRIMAVDKTHHYRNDDDIDSEVGEYNEFESSTDIRSSLSITAATSLVKDENDSKEILVNVISVDGRYAGSVQLPVHIPAIVHMDKELALEFATNLAEKLYIMYDGDDHHVVDAASYQLRVNSQYI